MVDDAVSLRVEKETGCSLHRMLCFLSLLLLPPSSLLLAFHSSPCFSFHAPVLPLSTLSSDNHRDQGIRRENLHLRAPPPSFPASLPSIPSARPREREKAWYCRSTLVYTEQKEEEGKERKERKERGEVCKVGEKGKREARSTAQGRRF